MKIKVKKKNYFKQIFHKINKIYKRNIQLYKKFCFENFKMREIIHLQIGTFFCTVMLKY